MAIDLILEDAPQITKPKRGKRPPRSPLVVFASGLASLKLTLVLLAMGIFLIFVGTLAQAQAGMWEAVNSYFWSWGTWVQLQVFLPKPWFPVWHEYLGSAHARAIEVPLLGSFRFLQHFPYVFSFPFPGGKTIGVAMMLNLLAAHTLRFRIQARGARLIGGIAALAIGIVLTYLIIVLGDFRQGLRDKPFVSWEATAVFTLIAAIASSLSLLIASVWLGASAWSGREKRNWVQAGLCAAGGLVSLVGCVLLVMFINDVSALRILWQLIQGTVAGVVLLAGCWLVFDKRGGIVLLHGGIGLMMISQLFVSLWAKEEQMVILEGSTAFYAQDIRKVELAVVASDENEESHTVISQAALERSLADGETKGLISNSDLPFDLRVVQFHNNAELREPEGANVATAGVGLQQAAAPKATGAGASSDSEVDFPAAYVTLVDKKTGKDIGTYLASVQVTLANFVDQVKVGAKTYDLALRFVRDYKDYQVTAVDVRKEDYPGSTTPRKFESDVIITDPRFGVKREVTIFMNNPFRYLGETYYQSNYRADPVSRKEETTFQVVSNAGWMIPYVACMIVAVGMLYQFVHTLMGFVLKDSSPVAGAPAMSHAETSVALQDKRGRGGRSKREIPPVAMPRRSTWGDWFYPSWGAWISIALSLLVIVAGLYYPKPKLAAPEGETKFDLYAFGQLPVVSGGRAKPMDSLARETLLAMSNRTTYKSYYEIVDGKEKPLLTAEEIEAAKKRDAKQVKSRTHPASEWLLDTIAKPEVAEHYQVVRIENPEVIAALKLPQDREGMRYSVAELRKSAKEYDEQLEQIRSKDKDARSAYDQKLIELDSRLQAHMRVATAFKPLPLPEIRNADKSDPQTMDEMIGMFQMIRDWHQRTGQIKPPLAVPVTDASLGKIMGGESWLPFSIAVMLAEARVKMAKAGLAESGEIDTPTASLNNIFAAYVEGDAATFNSGVKDYANWLEKESPKLDLKGDHVYHRGGVEAEAYFNHVAPFGWTQGILLYLLAFVVSAVGLMAFRRNVGSAAFWMLVVAFTLHSVALGLRMYISGRPPVTNLYSSAVFIGWFGVLAGLVLEGAFRLGVGNMISAICGLGGLMVAHLLSFEGDTIGVEVAVLDTQFWLSTHVVSITIGYGATFVAGFLGILYILLGLFTPIINRRDGKLLGRIIYGTVCFALFFSFVGTVLGGLWADDSWGRFWGWDPKENGALIIVLWNAFILHAKWDKVANERGVAVLAVFGNVVTTWSWFGTNQLGIGLHSYGFTSGVLVALAVTVLVHLGIIGLGLLPKQLWWSYRQRDELAVSG